MYNNTSRVLPYSSGQITGVILPRSEKILTYQDVDFRIEKVKKQIQHLTAQLPQRKTHGGKAFRAKKISLQQQISLASDRLNLLQTAKATIPKAQSTTLTKESSMIKMATSTAFAVSSAFGFTASPSGPLRKSSLLSKERFMVIQARY
ncbi:MAG: hypothetical protein PVI40_05225 [Chlamydiota bacterium]|jgi:hypothetical protein